MAGSEGCTEEEMQQLLKQRYDGYHFGKTLTDIYNPFSLLNAFYNKDIRDYWFASGTPTYLIRLMNHFNEGIDELTGKYYSLDEFVNYKADTEYPLPMIYQSGYLTIKDYDRRRLDLISIEHSIHHAPQGGRARKGTLFPIHFLSVAPPDERLYRFSGTGAE